MLRRFTVGTRHRQVTNCCPLAQSGSAWDVHSIEEGAGLTAVGRTNRPARRADVPIRAALSATAPS